MDVTIDWGLDGVANYEATNDKKDRLRSAL